MCFFYVEVNDISLVITLITIGEILDELHGDT